MRKFKIDGVEYKFDRYQVLHQVDPQPYLYDGNYCATYDTPEYTRRNELLQGMRLAFATGVHGRPIQSILDIGFGNGAFMKFAKKQIPVVYGHDISGVPVPAGCDFTQDINIVVDCACFFDSLEHYPNTQFIKDMRCTTVIISLPFYPGLEKFPTWGHRKNHEHLHYYTLDSLQKWMWKMGWRLFASSKHEDIVRRRETDWNILSCGFKRK
jgi:hypothetical protein